MGGCPWRGKLWIQTSPWWPPPDYGRMNHHDVLLTVAIESSELFYKANGTLEWRFLPEAIVVWPTLRRPPLSLTLRFIARRGQSCCSGHSSLLFRQFQCWTAGPLEGWWWRIHFTITAALGLGVHGSNLAIPGRAALLDGHLFCRLFFVLYGCSKFISSFIFPFGFEAGKTAPWPSLGLHHLGKFLEPYKMS